MYKIDNYILKQIFKYFSLIFFIFLSISWLLQLTRLFTISNFIQIDILSILVLSIYLIPNILTIILPLILIFGILLCFLKLYKDKELISIFSLGLDLKPIRNSLTIFTIIILFIYGSLSFFISPKVYEIYKYKEFELRNTIDFDSMLFSNFININENTILDFNKKNNIYEDILISFDDTKENIIYAKRGVIKNNNNNYVFQLSDGLKISIEENNHLEKLEFENYVFNVDNNNEINLKIDDQNTLTIFDNFFIKDYKSVCFKLIDTIILLLIIYFFYINNIKNVNFYASNNVYFTINCLFFIISNQILKNSEIYLSQYVFTIIFILALLSIIFVLKKRYGQN